MIKKVAIILLVFLSLTSCDKEEDSWTVKRDELIGKWEGKVSFTQIDIKTNEVITGTKDVKVRFLNTTEAIVTETLFLTFENSSEYQWFYQPDPENIIFKKSNSLIISSIPESFIVVKKDNKSQTWSGSYKTFAFNEQTMTSSEVKVSEIWEMTKK